MARRTPAHPAREFRVFQAGQPPPRWDKPFGRSMSNADVDRLLQVPPFNRMDQTSFPRTCSLRDLLLNDTRILPYQDGDIICRRGDYGNSAFLIVSGTVRVDLDVDVPLPATVLGRRRSRRKGWFQAVAQLWRNPTDVEVRSAIPYSAARGAGSRYDETTGTVRVFLQDVPAVIGRYKTVSLGAGEFFGETAALGRVPRTATVFSEGETELLEIRWQGLRDIMRRDAALMEHIHRIYRQRNLRLHLLETPIFSHLQHTGAPDDCACEKCQAMREILQATKFSSVGDFDWHASYQKLVDEDPMVRLEREPVIAEEGHYVNGLILVRSGFARVTKRHDHGHRTVSYLGRGHTYGLYEIVHNWRHETQIPLQHTLRAVGYTAVLLVPTALIEKHVLGPDREKPHVPIEILPPDVGAQARSGVGSPELAVAERLGDEMLEFFVENRLINGTAAMVIRLDRCIQCDECVRACAATHDNNPRFIRHGPSISNIMVANACMHCADPVCMIGCPTGAIHRDPFRGLVVINDLTCIGCGTCAASCPYDNIRMVPIRNSTGNFTLGPGNDPIQKATKCDLCIDQLGGPACVRACPHDALRRLDLHQGVESLAAWINQ